MHMTALMTHVTTSMTHTYDNCNEAHDSCNDTCDNFNDTYIWQYLTGDNKLIAILALRVEPEPHVIDQTFRFHQPEQSFLKKSIRLPPFQNLIGGLVDRTGYQQLLVKCSDETIVCESYKRQNGEPQDVFIKVRTL